MLEADFNFKGIVQYFDECSLGDYKAFPYSGLWIMSGSQGSGKTLLAMHLIKKMIQEYPNVKLVSNINIFGTQCIPYKGIEDFNDINNGQDGIIFLIDEIQTLFNSLESAKMPPSTLQIWSQNRKNRRVIIGTSQRFNRVAKGLREQTKYNYECLGKFLCFYRYRVVDGSEYDDNGRLDPEYKKSLRNHFYIPNVSCMRMYNTYEVVQNEKRVEEC